MNVVSIDFDIIMAPCIDLYNHWISAKDYSIENVLLNFPFLENLNADLYIYKYLTNYIIDVLPSLNFEDIYFIENHEDIIKYIEKEPIILYNIDHHHDIGYDLSDKDLKIPLLEPTCSNWVKFLKDSYQLKDYIWINNDNSELPQGNMLKYYPVQIKSFRDFNLNYLVDKTDKLIICKSAPWVLPTYIPLFDLWIDICENYYNKKIKVL